MTSNISILQIGKSRLWESNKLIQGHKTNRYRIMCSIKDFLLHSHSFSKVPPGIKNEKQGLLYIEQFLNRHYFTSLGDERRQTPNISHKPLLHVLRNKLLNYISIFLMRERCISMVSVQHRCDYIDLKCQRKKALSMICVLVYSVLVATAFCNTTALQLSKRFELFTWFISLKWSKMPVYKNKQGKI